MRGRALSLRESVEISLGNKLLGRESKFSAELGAEVVSCAFERGDEHGCDPQQTRSEATATLFSVSVKNEVSG